MSLFPKPPKMFTIHLIETDAGHVQVLTDYTGEGERVMTLGSEIMNTLALIQPFTEGYLYLAAPMRSDAQH